DDLRARLSRAIVGQPMPTDVAALDAMVARDDGAALSRRLAGVSDGAQAELDLNWERDRLFNGAGFLVAFAYMTDLWRVGTALPGRQGDQIKQSAALYFVYAIDLVRLDGVRCADATAPEHRRRQLFAQNQPLVAFLRGLPRSTRMTIGSLSLAWESATATRRRDDPVLCADGMESMTAGLKAAGDAPLRHVPNAPGTFGRTYAVPPAPGYRPRFVPAAQSMAEQADRRRALPAYLTSFLTVPGDSASVPPPAPPGR
ncbi:hypothetical protein, partial [Sphingomonas bacterium]|uniref:hypothetical protein n=1 Tax=Sphingomonas bacterium TaxID=1895847 RepID=UPI001C2D4FC4